MSDVVGAIPIASDSLSTTRIDQQHILGGVFHRTFDIYKHL